MSLTFSMLFMNSPIKLEILDVFTTSLENNIITLTNQSQLSYKNYHFISETSPAHNFIFSPFSFMIKLASLLIPKTLPK